MQTISKIIYWISITLIFLFVVVPFIGQFTPLEITNKSFQDKFEQFRFFGLPVAILLTLFGTLKSKDSGERKTGKIALTITICIISIVILFITVFASMCKWTDNKILFENIHDNTTKIVLRNFGCGATDSGTPNYKVCKIKNISPALIWLTNIDTTKIDKQIWRRVDNN